MIMITIIDIILMSRECTAPKAGGGDGEREPCGLCKGEGKQQETCNDVSILIITNNLTLYMYVAALLSVLERVGALELVLEQLRGGGEEEAEDLRLPQLQANLRQVRATFWQEASI